MKSLRIVCIAIAACVFLLVACNEDEFSTQEMDGIIEDATAKRVCKTSEYLERQLQENPDMQENLERMELRAREFAASNELRSNNQVYTIPVVVHVVYKTAAENISEAQIQSQLQVLNDDFRRLNSDANNTWSQADDTQIEFCLATVDPNGNATTGITRTQTTRSSFNPDLDQMKKSNQGGINPWNPSQYLNIWVCNISDGVLGYAQFPGGPAATDGVVVGYNYFGTMGTAQAPFNLGRTGTHEVGHYLNLYHIWGDGPCGSDDNVADTPASDDANYGCANGHTSCGSADMIENYMDYSDDACMNLFTTGQKNRMRAVLAAGGARASLVTSNVCNGGGGGTTPTCTDGIQNGNETGVDCGGDCDPCATTPTCTDGVQNGNETGVDCGGSCPPCNTGGGSTEQIKIIVKTDYFGSETTWQLKDDSGAIIATGGPYPDGVIKYRAKKVTVDSDGCYRFRIFDSYGDGICCDEGNGKYWIKRVSDNSTIRRGNGQFGFAQSRAFCMSPNSNREMEEHTEEKLVKTLSISSIDAAGNVNVNIQNPPLDGSLSIIDAAGNVVREFPLGAKSEVRKINVDFLPQGNYTISMGKEGKRISQPLIKR